MSEQASFFIPETAPADRTTGRYILSDQAGITGLANAADFPDSA